MAIRSAICPDLVARIRWDQHHKTPLISVPLPLVALPALKLLET